MEVSAARRAVARLVEARIDQVADAMVAGYMTEIDSYGLLDRPEAVQDVRASTRMNVAVLIRAVGEGISIDDRAIAVLRELGRQRAAQGFPLHALLRAYQVGTRIAWEHMLEALGSLDLPAGVSAQVVAEASVAILGLTGQVSSAVTEAYLESERDTAATEERLRRDVFNELLMGPIASPDPLRDRAERVGYRLGAAHAVLALSFAGAQADSARERAAAELRAAPIEDALPLVEHRGSITYALLPAAMGPNERRLVPPLVAALERAGLAGDRMPWGAIGRIEPGVQGIAVSYRQAIRALDAARSLGTSPRLCAYTDMIPVMMLLADRSLAADARRAILEPLARREADQARLIATLRTFLEEDRNLVATAKRLYVHRHTLAARLERIEALFERSLSDRDDLTLVDLALRAEEVLSAPLAGESQGLPEVPAQRFDDR